MQVVCNQCHAVSEVDSDVAPSESVSCRECHALLALPVIELGADTSWLVLVPNGQAGPYAARQMAELLDRAGIDWSSLIWRPGLKGWRTARRDPLLVTSVSHARGNSAFGDTQRVSLGHGALLPATDTIVEPVRRALEHSPNDNFAASAAAVRTDSGEELTQVAHRPEASEPTEAFGAALSAAAPRLDPHKEPDTQPVVARASTPNSWLPSVQSMLLVAVVAFGFGVLAAAVWGRFFARHVQRAATVVVQPIAAPRPAVQGLTAPN